MEKAATLPPHPGTPSRRKVPCTEKFSQKKKKGGKSRKPRGKRGQRVEPCSGDRLVKETCQGGALPLITKKKKRGPKEGEPPEKKGPVNPLTNLQYQ